MLDLEKKNVLPLGLCVVMTPPLEETFNSLPNEWDSPNGKSCF